ncbi:hypothetical protein B0H13DRAFT_1917309 [Mycena leptocephala]|nr:hypothetical protein B0H13DRAFT_1917309 [Mycena leptocephala]
MDPESAVARLPYDILHDLFVLSTTDAIMSRDYYFPVVLSQVCSSWRFAALATPILWIILYTSSPNSDQGHLRSQAYFERSKGMRVNVIVRVPQNLTADAFCREFALLARNAPRIITLKLVCADMEQVPALFACLPVAMQLQVLRIVVGSRADRAMEFAFRLDQNAHLPTTFRLPAVDNGVRWSNWGTAGLTHLHLNGLARAARPSMESLWHMLEGCKSTLITFEFKGWAPLWDDEDSILESVDLPMLRSLLLFWLDDLSSVAGLISAPGLCHLSLQNGMLMTNPYPPEDESEFPDCDVPRLLEHLGPSCGVLEHMSLFGVRNCPRSAVDQFFAAMPELESIILCEVGKTVQDAVFQPECRFRVPHEAVLPKLVSQPTSVASSAAQDAGRCTARRVYLTAEQEDAAYEPTRTILGVILDMCIDEYGLEVISLQPPQRITTLE